MTEDEMVGWHHQHNRHGFGWTPGVGEGQGGLACRRMARGPGLGQAATEVPRGLGQQWMWIPRPQR